MTRRIVSLMTIGILACMLTFFTNGTTWANEEVFTIHDVTVDVDDANEKVTIQGIIDTDRGSDVTITITNPLGEIDYVNQVTSTQDGNFSFTYVPSSTWDGEYELRIGGERVSVPYEGSFQIGDEPPGNGQVDSASIRALVEKFAEEGEFANPGAARSLAVHLTAVGQFENKGAADKVVKHLNSFKQLLDHQKEKGFISDKAFDTLNEKTDALIKKWK